MPPGPFKDIVSANYLKLNLAVFRDTGLANVCACGWTNAHTTSPREYERL